MYVKVLKMIPKFLLAMFFFRGNIFSECQVLINDDTHQMFNFFPVQLTDHLIQLCQQFWLYFYQCVDGGF